jgi:hypothetical protein
MEKNTLEYSLNIIVAEDIHIVANSLGITLTKYKVDWILKNYNDWECNDTNSNWIEIVESMLYYLK